MATKILEIRLQIEWTGKSVMTARSGERTVDVRAYYAREERYADVRYGEYLRYNATRVAHKITSDLEMVSIDNYYHVRDIIESMLKMLHERSIMRACFAYITVPLLEDNDNEEHD